MRAVTAVRSIPMKRPTLFRYATALATTLACVGAAEAKTLVYCSEASPGILSPGISGSTATSDVQRQIYDRLVKFEPGTTRIVPALAESWESSADGTVYTFHLRRGVKFQTTRGFTPTRDFNADDVLYSFERQWKKDHPDHNLSGGDYESFDSTGMPKLLKSIDKVDDYTVRFVLNKPEAPFLANIALNWAGIMSKEYAEKNRAAGNAILTDQAPVGTGPYQLVNYQKDSVIRFSAHPGYWAGVAPIDTLIFAITPDATARWAKLQRGECQVVPFPNPSDLSAMRQTPGITVIQQPGLNIGYLGFNVEKKPFDDKRVRQALNMAIDRAAITSAVFQGTGQIAKNPIPPTMWSYNDAVKDYPYDPAKARQLLAEAGYPNGFKADLWAMPVQRPYNPNARRMAEMMQADLAKVGVTANIVSYEWGEYLKRSSAGDQEMILLGWTSDNGDPDNILGLLLGCAGASAGANKARWCNKDYDDLTSRARITTDVAERTKLYEQAQVLFKEEAPWVTMNHSIVFMVMSDQVKNYKIDPTGVQNFYGVDIAQ
jgi:dipeptide transport system substrate-binding protein